MTNENKASDAENQVDDSDVNAQEETAETQQATDAEQDGAYELDQDDGQVEIELADDEVEQLKAALADAKDQVIRAQADAQNVRRRAEKDVEGARKYALEKFAKDLLPVVDNLERTLSAVDSDEEVLKPLVEGVELTLKSFTDALGRFKIEELNPEGEPFDPQVHEAVGMVPNGDVEPNSVLHVAQKGYTLNGRVIRAAMVMVSKAPE